MAVLHARSDHGAACLIYGTSASTSTDTLSPSGGGAPTQSTVERWGNGDRYGAGGDPAACSNQSSSTARVGAFGGNRP